MKKSMIWAVAIVMGLSFLALLFLQLSYIEEMAKMKKEQFDRSVNRSLYRGFAQPRTQRDIALSRKGRERNRTPGIQPRLRFHPFVQAQRCRTALPPVCSGGQGRHHLLFFSAKNHHHKAFNHTQSHDTAVGQKLHKRGFQVVTGDCAQPIRISEGAT